MNQDSKINSKDQDLDKLWQQFGGQFRRRARTRLRQYGLAGQTESMDICNEVMVDLAGRQQANKLNADDVLAYIMRAIDNQVLDTFRTLARHCRDFRRNESTPVEDINVVHHATSPSQVALRREVLFRIRSILGESDAKAIDLMLQNCSWAEIGEALGIQADAARMRVRRAIEHARKELGVLEESD